MNKYKITPEYFLNSKHSFNFNKYKILIKNYLH